MAENHIEGSNWTAPSDTISRQPLKSLSFSNRETSRMASKTRSYRFTFGPWNISTGADPFGPPVRKEV